MGLGDGSGKLELKLASTSYASVALRWMVGIVVVVSTANGVLERGGLESDCYLSSGPTLAVEFSHTNSSSLAIVKQQKKFVSREVLAASDCVRTCGTVEIPYPFGLSIECAWSSDFLLECKENSETTSIIEGPGPWPYLTSASGTFTDQNATLHSVDSFQVLNVTAGTLIINNTAIKAMSCNGDSDHIYGNASIILPANGPYVSSRSNVFFVSGCRSRGQYDSVPISQDDVGTICGPNSCENQYTYDFCNFYDCCTSSMEPMREIYIRGGGIGYTLFEPCGFCSVVFPDTYKSLNKVDIGIGTYGLQLLWSLRANSTLYPNCSTLETMQGYACSRNATCSYVSVPEDIAGYYCECTLPGFTGDGYINGTQCDDIDECTDHPDWCVQEATCQNVVGSYNCICPVHMEGNGLSNVTGGTGCKYIDYCTRENDCHQDAYCSSSSGLYTCTCPKGLVGDGLKNGTGCKSDSKTALIAGLSAGGLLLLVIINGFVIWYFYRNRAKYFGSGPFGPVNFSRKEFLLELQSKQGANSCRIFTYEELKKATNNFSANRELGSGGFGTVYGGTLDDGTKLAVKQSKYEMGGANDNTKQFVNEVNILSQVNHRNLVKLLGCCLETAVPILVYEFISNGNLLEHLQREPSRGRDGKYLSSYPPLDWSTRLKIAIGTAEALTYLHSGTSPPIYHRDVKTANILVDDKYVAKVADFGISKFVPLEATHLSTALQGTPGYLDPEFFETYQITEKSDVYSFGVVLLELVTAQKPVDLSRQARDHNLALRCSRLLRMGRLEDVIDPILGVSSNVKLLDSIHAVAMVAMKCVEKHREDRPTMREVLEELQSIAKPVKRDMGSKAVAIDISKSGKHVKLEEDSMPLVQGMTTNSQDFYLSSDISFNGQVSSRYSQPNATTSSSSTRFSQRGADVLPR